MIRRAISALVAVGCAVLAAWLAMHHPLSPVAALAACAGLAALTIWRPARWPLWLLPLWPLGLMTWTGWFTVEEFDLALLAMAAAAYARLAAGWPRPADGPDGAARSPARVGLLLLPFAASVVASLVVGVQDAGGWSVGWWQGYREPLNSLRLAKPVAEVLLLLPLWRAACRADARGAQRDLVLGLCGILALTSLAVLWERLAFTGLADFSSDYRVTGPFWEMHIGGAALDATLAMTLGAAALVLMRARTPLQWSVAVLLVAIGAYSSVVTFSRIVFLAVPLALGIGALLQALQKSTTSAGPREPAPWVAAAAAAAWTAVFATVAAWTFPTSGYRGLLALLGVAALLLPLPGALALLTPLHLGVGLGLGVLLACMVAVAAALSSKGVYIAYAVLFGIGALGLWGTVHARARPGTGLRSPVRWSAALALGGFVATVSAMVGVAAFWGGPKAAIPALGGAAAAGAAALAGGAMARRGRELWMPNWAWHGRTAALLLVAGVAVAAFHGGDYLSQRMSQSTQDGEGRLGHWQRSLALLRGTDWLWGKGLGRFWAHHADTGRRDDQTGDYRWLAGRGRDGGGAVVLTSGLHMLGWGEMLRLSQRLSPAVQEVSRLSLDLRADRDVHLDIVVCANHLIYPSACVSRQLLVKGQPDVWQTAFVEFKPGTLPAPHPLWPALKMFEIAFNEGGDRADLDNLHLTDAAGRELLQNGGFENGMAHWFFTSDRWHMPFHAKSLPVHLLFEQGLFGLLAFGLAAAAALWRTTVGAGRAHPLAPLLAGAIAAALAVGAIDSLLDMPRVAFLLLFLISVALALPRSGPDLMSRRQP